MVILPPGGGTIVPYPLRFFAWLFTLNKFVAAGVLGTMFMSNGNSLDKSSMYSYKDFLPFL